MAGPILVYVNDDQGNVIRFDGATKSNVQISTDLVRNDAAIAALTSALSYLTTVQAALKTAAGTGTAPGPFTATPAPTPAPATSATLVMPTPPAT